MDEMMPEGIAIRMETSIDARESCTVIGNRRISADAMSSLPT